MRAILEPLQDFIMSCTVITFSLVVSHVDKLAENKVFFAGTMLRGFQTASRKSTHQEAVGVVFNTVFQDRKEERFVTR